jgi:hypothetical protein
MACHAVNADEEVFAYLWLRRRWKWFGAGRSGFILALSFPLLSFGRNDMSFTVVA